MRYYIKKAHSTKKNTGIESMRDTLHGLFVGTVTLVWQTGIAVLATRLQDREQRNISHRFHTHITHRPCTPNAAVAGSTAELRWIRGQHCTELRHLAERCEAKLRQMATERDVELRQMATEHDVELRQMATEHDVELRHLVEGCEAKLRDLAEGCEAKLRRTGAEHEAELRRLTKYCSGHYAPPQKCDRLAWEIEQLHIELRRCKELPYTSDYMACRTVETACIELGGYC